MQTAPRLVLPPLGKTCVALAPAIGPLIRLVAGGSLAIHGYPILFGDIAAIARFRDSTGLANGVFWAYMAGLVGFVCGLVLALGFLTRPVAVPSIGFLAIAIASYHWQFGSTGKIAGTNILCFGRSWFSISSCAAAANGRSTLVSAVRCNDAA